MDHENSPPGLSDLAKTCDYALIESLPLKLKAVIDKLLKRGLSKLSILTVCEGPVKAASRGDPNKGKLLMLGIEAYLEATEVDHGMSNSGGKVGQ